MEETTNHNHAEQQLASRWVRLGAVLIDGVVGILLSLPLMFYFDIWSLAESGDSLPISIMVVLFIWGVSTFVAVNYWLLNNKGQTVGKWLTGISIVGIDGNRKSGTHLLIYRYLPLWLLVQVPLIGNLVSIIDGVFIFREDRRCIHDLIAGTKVIDPAAKSSLKPEMP